MTYIYDIVLNFNEFYYEFFEWKKDDNIINIKKIPLFNISNKDYLILKNNKVKVDKEFLNRIPNISNYYIEELNNNIVCLVSNKNKSLGLMFNKDGYLIKRSSLLLDEEEETIEESRMLDIINIKYIENIKINQDKKGRVELEKKNYILNFINKLDIKEDDIILKYLYYEYYEKENKNTLDIKDKLISVINSNWNSKLDNLYNFIDLIQSKKV